LVLTGIIAFLVYFIIFIKGKDEEKLGEALLTQDIKKIEKA
jgi:hypothetical protein